MKIDFCGEKISLKLKKDIKKAVKVVLNYLGQEHKPLLLSVTFLNGEEMKELNARTRNINKVTDVLSYPNFNLSPFQKIDVANANNYMGKYVLLGDMAICLDKVKEQAKEYGITENQEVIKLVIHSVLHLMGFDHIQDSDYAVMKAEEDKIASVFYKF